MNKETVTFDVAEGIGIITIDDPPANYLSLPEFIPFDRFLGWISNPEMKGLIITGGGKNFSAGGDLNTIFNAAPQPEALQALMQDGHRLLFALQELDIPVVAAINKVCFGGGLEIALACHIRVASENAMLAFPEVNHNLMPGMGGTFRLPLLAGFSASAQMLLGGDMLSAPDARQLGLVDYIAPKDMALQYSLNLLRKMTQDRPVKVIRSIMQALKNAVHMQPEEAMKEETRLFADLARDEAGRRKKINTGS
jgi:enoyl-CoA hydratase/carnithine racemase